MSKPRIMGAGLAGSTTVDVNVNGNQGGGSKKQGLPGITNMRSSLVFSVNQRAYGTPVSRDKVFYINQLSTIGPKSTMFSSTADGVQTFKSIDMSVIVYEAIKGINEVYGDDYEVVLAGESETLVDDLNAVHMDTSSVPDNFFQILQSGNELYEALSDDIKTLINVSNQFIGHEYLGLNRDYDDGINYGAHKLALIPKAESDYKSELNENGFGTVNFTFRYTIDGVVYSTGNIPVYRKHHSGFWNWVKHHKVISIVVAVAAVAVVAVAMSTGVGEVAVAAEGTSSISSSSTVSISSTDGSILA